MSVMEFTVIHTQLRDKPMTTAETAYSIRISH